jgi:hypothetical protein
MNIIYRNLVPNLFASQQKLLCKKNLYPRNFNLAGPPLVRNQAVALPSLTHAATYPAVLLQAAGCI